MTLFWERLKKVRKVLGLDQRAFGVEIGVAGRDTISRWERGLGFPSADILAKMRQKYRINIDWLISGEGEPFVGEGPQEGQDKVRGKGLAIDPILYLLSEEEEMAGITLTPAQRTAILKILRELIYKEVRSIRELLLSIPGEDEQGDEA
jgi:transcriptional regulator with XRE-family HTH domain